VTPEPVSSGKPVRNYVKIDVHEYRMRLASLAARYGLVGLNGLNGQERESLAVTASGASS